MMNSRVLFLVIGLIALTTPAGGYAEISYSAYRNLFLFPNQVATADVICTGTVAANRSGDMAEFSIDELLWGNLPSTNIQIRCIDKWDKLTIESSGKYLVFAFTNNWWADAGIDHESAMYKRYLSNFLTSTSLPPSKAVFPDCRIMHSSRSVFKFDKFEINGTNYWPGTRAFITNFLEITRIQNDNIKAFRKLKSYFYESPESTTIPPWLLRHFHLYYGFRYHGVEPERP